MEGTKKIFEKNDPVAPKSREEAAKLDGMNVMVSSVIEGTVTNCLSLNLRAEPKTEARILAELTALDKVTVNMDKSTDEFYSVRSSSGVNGYCMRKFIAVKR